MDLGNSKASDLERRLSRRSSVRLSVNAGEGGDGDGDDGLDFSAATISDGFRPPQQSDATADENETPPTARSAVPANPTETTSPPLPTRPSSIAKHPRPSDSFSLRHDGVMGPIEETASTHSSSSTTDSQPYIAPQSPYHGPSNPSHPYQMYMQNVRLARTPSVTTTSTTPLPDSSYPDPRGPTHPYSMYPQGTAASESSTAPPTVIPVGFPGIPDQYQRRIGPEGEDIGDIIGPDGHTEQLPPYTRYPDEPYAAKGGAAEQSTAPAPAAVTSTAVANVAPEASAPASAAGLTVPPAAVLATATATPAAPATLAISQPIPGAGGIGLATLDPEFEAIDDLDSPHSRHSLRSFASESSHRAINQAAAGAAVVSEKRGRLRGSHWGQRRLGGIVPYWAIGLAILALVLMSAVLGSVIGTFLTKHKKPPPKHDGNGFFDSMPSATISYDASPIPTPTDLPPLVTGEFSMPLMNNRISSTCFNDTQLSQAWSCNLLIFAGLSMVIEDNLETPEAGDYTVSLNCNDTQTLGNFVYTYGEQPPLILDPVPMELVNDTLEPSRGPAWFKMLPYNKTVILHESQLQAPDGDDSSAQVRRNFNSFDGPGPGPGDIKRKGTARTGDRPWICTWPETLLEIFIYPMQNSSWARPLPPPPTSFPSMTSGTFTGAAPTPTGEHPFGGDGGGGGDNPFGSHISDFDFPTPTSGSPASSETGHFDQFPPPPYPRVVKVEERRVSDSPMATCRQVEVVADGQPARPVKDAKGNDVVINIIENTPVNQSEEVKMVLERRGQYYNPLLRRDSSADLTSCGCMWFLT